MAIQNTVSQTGRINRLDVFYQLDFMDFILFGRDRLDVFYQLDFMDFILFGRDRLDVFYQLYFIW